MVSTLSASCSALARAFLGFVVATGAACGDDAPERVATSTTRVTAAVPTTTSQPSAPVAPNEPAEPAEPLEPAEPAEPVEPAEPAEPAEPGEPVEPLEPSEPGDGCENGLICVETFPHIDLRDTTHGISRFNAYSCAPNTNEGGPELVYRVEVPDDGLLVARLDDMPPGVDVDVHILADLDPATCIDRGHTTAVAHVGAGTWYVVVDSWVNAQGVAKAGPFSLSLGLTRATDFETTGLDGDVLHHGLTAFAKAWQARQTDRLEYTVIDFSLHSAHPRLWTIDLSDGALLFAERVSHGEGSAAAGNPAWADKFSNIENSHQSSLGLMKAASRYMSASNGLSMRLDGLERGFNDQVRNRAIVIHADSYATPAYVATHGRMGLSWGCPVIDPARIEAFISTIEGGSLLWSWYPDQNYLMGSNYLDAR